jgi:hypothetical protein
MDYSLRRWPALTEFLTDAQVPIDNNWVENQIRPIALGRKNWLFAGSLRAGQRAAAVMSLIQSAKLNGHDPHAYLKDVMDRSGPACLNSFTPRDKETAGDLDRCRVVHGGGRRLRRTPSRGGQLGAH